MKGEPLRLVDGAAEGENEGQLGALAGLACSEVKGDSSRLDPHQPGPIWLIHASARLPTLGLRNLTRTLGGVLVLVAMSAVRVLVTGPLVTIGLNPGHSIWAMMPVEPLWRPSATSMLRPSIT